MLTHGSSEASEGGDFDRFTAGDYSMIELKHLLLPVDFSDSCAATEYAVSLGHRFGAALHLLHVIEDPIVYLPMFESYPPANPRTISRPMLKFGSKTGSPSRTPRDSTSNGTFGMWRPAYPKSLISLRTTRST